MMDTKVDKLAWHIVCELIDAINSDRTLLTSPMYNKDPTELNKIIKDRIEQRLRVRLSILERIKSTLSFFEIDDHGAKHMLNIMKDFKPEHYQHKLGEDNARLTQENQELRKIIFYLLTDHSKDIDIEAYGKVDMATVGLHDLIKMIYGVKDWNLLFDVWLDVYKQISPDANLSCSSTIPPELK